MRKNLYWGLALAGAVMAIGWYVSAQLDKTVVFPICSVAALLMSAYLLSDAERQKVEQRKQEMENLLQRLDALQEALHLADTREENRLNAVAAAIEESRAAVQGTVQDCFAKTVEMEQENRSDRTLRLDAVCEALARQNSDRAEAEAALRSDMSAIASSFENAEAAYREMEIQMEALKQQNIHLQMLTTMIGTTRSDVALLNEVRGFVQEQKAGRKIRLIRDDEHGVVVENLMNSDGVRIEKSMMYQNKKLVFEASFDALGKMQESRSYGENGELSTVVTYDKESRGLPKLRDMADMAMEKLKGKRARNGSKKVDSDPE